MLPSLQLRQPKQTDVNQKREQFLQQLQQKQEYEEKQTSTRKSKKMRRKKRDSSPVTQSYSSKPGQPVKQSMEQTYYSPPPPASGGSIVPPAPSKSPAPISSPQFFSKKKSSAPSGRQSIVKPSRPITAPSSSSISNSAQFQPQGESIQSIQLASESISTTKEKSKYSSPSRKSQAPKKESSTSSTSSFWKMFSRSRSKEKKSEKESEQVSFEEYAVLDDEIAMGSYAPEMEADDDESEEEEEKKEKEEDSPAYSSAYSLPTSIQLESDTSEFLPDANISKLSDYSSGYATSIPVIKKQDIFKDSWGGYATSEQSYGSTIEKINRKNEYLCDENIEELYATGEDLYNIEGRDYLSYSNTTIEHIIEITGENDLYSEYQDYSVEQDENEECNEPTELNYLGDIKLSSELHQSSSNQEFLQKINEKNIWNTLFQNAYDRLTRMNEKIASNDEKIQIYKTLSSLARNFSYTAELYGKIIIAEKNLPDNQKTIKPLNLHGIIGGQKFIVHGILFKFAVDSSSFLKDDEYAMKIANHELKSLDNLLNLNTSSLHYPLLAIIDYRGYRLIAMATLPVSNQTLMFGSSDAGKSIQDQIPKLKQLTFDSCKKLNLKPHHVGDKSNPVLVPGPVDLECHKGFDNRFYILDFSRLYPPDLLSKNIHCSSLFRLLRPELVKSFSIPLCSDTFSKFVSNFPEESLEHRIEIKKAHEYLVNEIIPAFSLMLSSQDANLFQVEQIIHSMHREGINIRYFGYIRKGLNEFDKNKNKKWSDLILTEILARTIKWDIRKILRKTTEASVLPIPTSFNHKENVIKYLNTFFGNSISSLDYWKNFFIPSICVRFPQSLSDFEKENVSDFRSFVIDSLSGGLFLRLNQISGIQFTHDAMNCFSSMNKDENFFNSETPFDVIHLDDFTSSVKQLSVVEKTNAFFHLIRAKYLSKNQHYHNQLLHKSLFSFEKALECNPADKLSLLHCAKLHAKINSPKALTYFNFALQVDSADQFVTFSFARYLHKNNIDNEKREAENYYLLALEANPNFFKAMFYYGSLLYEVGVTEEILIVQTLFTNIINSDEAPENIILKVKEHPHYKNLPL